MAIVKLPDGRWRVDVEPVKGKRFRKTVKTKGEALRFEAHCRANFEQILSDNEKRSDKRKLSDLVAIWFDMHGQNLRDGKSRKSKLMHLSKALFNPVAVTLNSSHFANYRVQRLHLGISAKTLNNELGYLRAVFNELLSLGVIDYPNPLDKIKPLQVQEKSLTFLSPVQISELLNAIQSGCDNPHVYPVTLLCLSTGCRWSEAEKLKPKNLHDNQIFFEGTKSGKVRAVPVSAELVSLVREHWLQHGYFTGSLSSFRRALMRCSFQLPAGQASHVLRHTFASHFVQGGGNILILQKILGHSSLAMTMRYSHLAPEHLADALRLNPLASFDTLATPNRKNKKNLENV